MLRDLQAPARTLVTAAAAPRRRAGLRRAWRLGGPALLLALVGLLGWVLEPVLQLESGLGLRMLFAARGPQPAPPEVLVVAIDERSAQAFGLPERPRQWPRRLHADLVRQLHAAGARLVAFDLTFEAETPDDVLLADSLRQAGNVVLTSSLRTDVWPGGPAQAVVEQVRPAAPAIGEAARDQAPFVLPKDSRVDAYWTFRSGADHMPSLPVLAFHLFHPQAVDALAVLACEGAPAVAACAPGEAGGFARLRSPSAAVRRLREHLSGDPAAAARIAPQLPGLPQAVGTLLALHAGDDVAHLNFYGPARSIRTVSYADVATLARDSPELFAGRMVFVGFSAQSSGAQDRLRDDYRTVYSDDSGVDISGVEIAATAFANLQQGRPLVPLPPAATAASLVGWGALLGLLAGWRARRWPLAGLAALAVIWLAGAHAAFVQQAAWWPLVVPLLLQWPVAVALALWLGLRHSRRERDRMHHVFAHFVPHGVAEQLAGAPEGIGAAHRLSFGACLATDAEQYTALAERLAPGALGERLNAYYAQLFEPVHRHGGTVIDVVGDAMVAVWEQHGTPAGMRQAACETALDIQSGMAQGGGAGLPTRIGLHCGEMRIGTVGAGRHYEFRAVGDAVNTASRLEGLNKWLGSRVLASAEMVDGVQGLLLRPLGRFVLAGKEEPVQVVQVLGRLRDTLPAQFAREAAFAAALAHYRAGAIDKALPAFELLASQWPDDGTIRHYLTQCRYLWANPAHHDPKLPIRLTGK